MKYILLIAFSLIVGASAGSFGGFKTGYWLASQSAQRQALAHECGRIDPKTLAFSWNTPVQLQLAASAIPANALPRR